MIKPQIWFLPSSLCVSVTFDWLINCPHSLDDGDLTSSSGRESFIHPSIHLSIHLFLHLSIRFLVVSWVMLAVGALRCRPGGAGVLLSPHACVVVWCFNIVFVSVASFLCLLSSQRSSREFCRHDVTM